MTNVFSRQQFGALILFACVLNATVLALFHVKLYTLHKSLLINTSKGFDYSFSFSATYTWSLAILIAFIIIGLWLLFAPTRKKLSPKLPS